MVSFMSFVFGMIALFGNTWLYQCGYELTFVHLWPSIFQPISFFAMLALSMALDLIREPSLKDVKLSIEKTSDEVQYVVAIKHMTVLMKNALIVLLIWLLQALIGF